MSFFMNYYGVAPLEVIYKLYKLKVKDSIDEMIAMLWNMPMDIMESCIIPIMGLKSKVLSKNNPIYTSRGLLVHMPILTNNQLDSLLNIQKDIPFYIPTVKQIEELGTIAYEESSPAYVNLKSFFIKKLGIPNELAISWCLNIWANSYEGKSSSEIIDKLLQRNIVFQNEKQMDDFKLLLLDAHNSVRKIENRGYTFTELLKRKYV